MWTDYIIWSTYPLIQTHNAVTIQPTSRPCHAQQDVSFSINYNILLSHNWWPLISLAHAPWQTPNHLHDLIHLLHGCHVLLISAPFIRTVCTTIAPRVLHFSAVHSYWSKYVAQVATNYAWLLRVWTLIIATTICGQIMMSCHFTY